MSGRGSPGACLRWGMASAAAEGQVYSGDRHLVTEAGDGVLVCVVDGLGHGPEACEAAEAALSAVARFAEEPLIDLVTRCDRELRRTRGVVLSAARIEPRQGSLAWIGVGNVEGTLVRAAIPPRKEALLARSGVVGYQLPPLRAATLKIELGDTLVFATDGIRAGYLGAAPLDDPERAAQAILASHRKLHDDALVVVARYLGEGGGAR